MSEPITAESLIDDFTQSHIKLANEPRAECVLWRVHADYLSRHTWSYISAWTDMSVAAVLKYCRSATAKPLEIIRSTPNEIRVVEKLHNGSTIFNIILRRSMGAKFCTKYKLPKTMREFFNP